MDVYQWLCVLGIPSLIAAFVGFVAGQIKSVKALKKGVQALLRAQMINDYNKWTDRGYAPLYARQNYENLWVQYEALGDNGVISDLHDKFLKLPTEIPTKEGKK